MPGLSVAGRRAGLAGERSALFFEFARLLGALGPRWCLIENVPGLLSSNGGRDFGVVLDTLGKLGYWWTYRVLDSQYFGVAQRRRRVYVVGHLGGPCPAEILFEPESLRRDTPPRRETGSEVAGTIGGRVKNDLDGHGAYVANILHTSSRSTTTGRSTPTYCMDLQTEEVAEHGMNSAKREASMETRAMEDRRPSYSVRRLTPTECERLQGFPDGWTTLPTPRDTPPRRRRNGQRGRVDRPQNTGGS